MIINKTKSIGSWISIGSTSIAEIMADAGFDWLCIDIEHSAIDYEKMQDLILTIQSKGLECFVRVGGNDAIIIKRVLDSGANGVIIPLIKNKNDAVEAVKNTFYPPKGERGVNSLSRAQGYGFKFEEYASKVNIETNLILQIEHIDAINNLEDIISTDGVTGTIIGPYDLSASMGIPGELENEKVKDAISKYEQLCKKYKKPLGFHVVEPKGEMLQQKIELGYKFLALSWDGYFLGKMCRDQLKKVKY